MHSLGPCGSYGTVDGRGKEATSSGQSGAPARLVPENMDAESSETGLERQHKKITNQRNVGLRTQLEALVA